MNNRSKLFGVIVVPLLLLVGWWLWTSRQVKPSEAKTAISAITVAPKSATSQPTGSNAQPASAPTPTPVDPKVAKIEAIWAGQNSQAQDFYGKAIDQHGEPVAGATVIGTLMQIQGVDVGTKKDFYTQETDSDGNFEFTGLHGWQLGVVVKKGGFQMGQGTGFYQPPNKADKSSPTERAIFHMWKLQGAEPMVKARIHAYIPCDGTPTMFDLTTGKRVENGGNLTVRLSRDPVDIVRGKPFNWQLTVEVSGGGLQEITDLYPNEAPADGYQQSVTVSMPVGTKNWSPDLQRVYYFTTGNGQDYGRISIDLTGDFQPPPTSFDADIYVNTTGSRNLEFDPSKQVR